MNTFYGPLIGKSPRVLLLVNMLACLLPQKQNDARNINRVHQHANAEPCVVNLLGEDLKESAALLEQLGQVYESAELQ